jgi:hypothetical protein
MTTAWRRSAVILVGVLATSGRPVDAQNSSQFRDWKPSALADGAQLKPRTACAALVALTGYEFSVSSATTLPATADSPERCRVTGQILPEIRFEVSLPAVWNGRLYMFGNGGFAGEQLDATGRVATARRALAHGFAVAQTNTGHNAQVEPLGTFASSPQKVLDYAYRSVHVTALTAKKILQAYYDGELKHSYFDGCSTGGRQGLISAERFPDDFDGIVVGAPVLNFSGTMISYASMQRALKVGPIGAEKIKLVGDAVYGKCDAIDGVKDGLIDDPRKCAFKPSEDLPRCASDVDGPACFTSAQIRSLEAIYAGVVRGGSEFFPGWPVGSEGGWTPWFVGPPKSNPIQVAFGDTFFKYLAFARPVPAYEWLSFDVDADLDKLQATRSLLDATDPDLSRFKARGGKIVSYFGWADPALNPMMGIKYYESITQKMGAPPTEFYRMFMVPGMYHCQGGIGVSTFDALTPLVEWVEKGTPPQQIVGSRLVDGKPVRSRPLCPYPQVAKYKGSGSIDEAANFSCATP